MNDIQDSRRIEEFTYKNVAPMTEVVNDALIIGPIGAFFVFIVNNEVIH